MRSRFAFLAALPVVMMVSTLAAAQGQGSASAPPASPPAQTVHHMPAGAGTDMAALCAHVNLSGSAHFYPTHARDNHIEGQTLLECALDVSGHLQTCWLLSETPTNEHFGETALRLACFARERSAARTHFQVAGDVRPHITMPLNFRLAEGR